MLMPKNQRLKVQPGQPDYRSAEALRQPKIYNQGSKPEIN
jgi:hypothetical protein